MDTDTPCDRCGDLGLVSGHELRAGGIVAVADPCDCLAGDQWRPTMRAIVKANAHRGRARAR